MPVTRRVWAALLLASAPLAAAESRADIRFREVSGEWGIEFRHHHCGSGKFYMVETMGSGVVVLDYDGDGDQDVLFVDSGPLPGCAERPRSVLYRNDGGTFVDVTGRAGIEVTAYGMGGTAGDADGDGDLDLYVTAFGANQLFLNDGEGGFRDATATAAVADPLWGASAAFADVDLDGDLDLYVTNYVDFGLDNNPTCGSPRRRLVSYCHPDEFNPLPDRFYRNLGGGRFAEATAEAGFGGAKGSGLGVVFSDVDGDGDADLYVANDMNPNYLFLNRGDGSFEEAALLSGVALSDRGAPEAGMGVDVGDLDGDGRPEIMVTHLDQQTNALYSAGGGGVFVDRRYPSDLAEPSLHQVGFGVLFGDLDQDRDLDVVVANGHIIHNIDQWDRGTTYRQRNQIFRNLGTGRFEEVASSGLDVVASSRGLAGGDLDGDGDLDLLVNNSNEASEVYRNDSEGGGYLQVDLETAGGEGFGIGAALELEAGGAVQRREVRSASSYLSQSALTAHFGLGSGEVVERLRIRWPGGPVQELRDLPAGRRLRVAPRGAGR